MEPIEDQNCTEEFEEVYRINKTADDATFDQIIMELQDVLIDIQFQNTLLAFMRNNWGIMDGSSNKQNQFKVFEGYQLEMKNYIQNKIRVKVRDFNWTQFWSLLEKRKHLVDEQMLDTLLSLSDIQNFKSFIKDFKSSHEQEEMLKVLTIKSNKISHNKKVKGKDNIFANDQNNIFNDKPNKMAVVKRKPASEKTQQELLVPNLILTVKSMRKC